MPKIKAKNIECRVARFDVLTLVNMNCTNYKMMKSLLLLGFMCSFGVSHAQHKVMQIAFHLYTDSLKKGTYNYINVDAFLEKDYWRPMDTSHVAFASSAGQWSGNNLMVDKNFALDSVVVRAFLKSNPIMAIDTTIYIKKNDDPQSLPTMDDIMNENKRRRRNG